MMAIRSPARGWKVALLISACAAVLFVLFGGLAWGYSLRSIAFLAASGAVFGAIGAPHLEPEAFLYPTLWQVFVAVIGCVLIAAYLEAGWEGYVLALAVGLIVGYLAPYWIKHVQVP